MQVLKRLDLLPQRLMRRLKSLFDAGVLERSRRIADVPTRATQRRMHGFDGGRTVRPVGPIQAGIIARANGLGIRIVRRVEIELIRLSHFDHPW